jgi:hypothetical protein
VRLFQRKRAPRTGNPIDDDLLGQLAARTDLSLPRHWMHFLYVADESTARAAADEVISDGWDLDRVDVAADGRGWVVIAEQHDAVLTPDRVAAARRFFEGLADRSAGGDYDGGAARV